MSSVSPNIMNRLKKLRFPECTQEALQYIMSTLASQECSAIPGLSEGPEMLVGELCQAYVLFRTEQNVKIESALEELQLLELLCGCFQRAAEKCKYRLFQLMFGQRGDQRVNALLTRLVSMALSVGCTSVLDCAAIWMQERNCHSSESLLLTSRLVEDYCLLFQNPSKTFQQLPSISPLFVCNFTTAVTALYTFSSVESVPPLNLLERVTWWVSLDCTLCCESIRQASIHATCSSPIPGLLAWCVLGPLVCSHLLHAPSPGSPHDKAQLRRTLGVLSELHLGLLHSLEFCGSSSLSQCLLSVTHLISMLSQLSQLSQRFTALRGEGEGAQEREVLHLAMERLAQVMQMARMARCLLVQRGSLLELAKMTVKHLPPNRLLNMVVGVPKD